MSFRNFLTRLNSPALVLGSGAAVLVGLPLVSTSGAPLYVLQAANILAYAVNCAAVSVPGRIDGQAQEAMQGGNAEYESVDSASHEYQTLYSPTQGRSLVAPAGWAFAIWGPIYLGEAIFCTSLLLLPSSHVVLSTLPSITAPLVAAHLCQSLWCASFRASYMTADTTWQKYVSVAMLGGTAYSLSLVHAATVAGPFCWFFWPLTLHFGWTTAATLVNFNGSFAASRTSSDTSVIGVGHASALVGTALGVAVTLLRSSPVYGLTVAWALAACADGMQKRLRNSEGVSAEIQRGRKVQQMLCYAGSGICAAVAVGSFFL
jgi:hypothetical protein